jgi:hypothetical protein
MASPSALPSTCASALTRSHAPPQPAFVLKSSLDEATTIHVSSESSSVRRRTPSLIVWRPIAHADRGARRPQPTFAKGTKLFINVAQHALLPEPPRAPPSATVEDLWIPAVVGEMAVTIDRGASEPLPFLCPRTTADQQRPTAGKTSLVVDVVFHTSVTEKAKREPNYKLFLIQVVLEKVEDKFDVELSRGASAFDAPP